MNEEQIKALFEEMKNSIISEMVKHYEEENKRFTGVENMLNGVLDKEDNIEDIGKDNEKENEETKKEIKFKNGEYVEE